MSYTTVFLCRIERWIEDVFECHGSRGRPMRRNDSIIYRNASISFYGYDFIVVVVANEQ